MNAKWPSPCYTKCGGYWMPRLTNFNSKHGSVWHVCLCGSTIKWAELAIHVYVAVYPPNNSKIHNLPSCPSVVETTSRKKNKQQNPRIAGSQCVLLSTLQLMTTAIQLCSLVPHPLTAVRCTREKLIWERDCAESSRAQATWWTWFSDREAPAQRRCSDVSVLCYWRHRHWEFWRELWRGTEASTTKDRQVGAS